MHKSTGEWLLGGDLKKPEPSKPDFSKTAPMQKPGYDVIIGAGSTVSGTLELKGLSRIDGSVEGEVRVEGELHIGESGVVHSNVEGKTVRISGKVLGDIRCEEHLELLRGAEVRGNITTSSLAIQEGVSFEGYCDMKSAQAEQVQSEVLELSSSVEFEGEPEQRHF